MGVRPLVQKEDSRILPTYCQTKKDTLIWKPSAGGAAGRSLSHRVLPQRSSVRPTSPDVSARGGWDAAPESPLSAGSARLWNRVYMRDDALLRCHCVVFPFLACPVPFCKCPRHPCGGLASQSLRTGTPLLRSVSTQPSGWSSAFSLMRCKRFLETVSSNHRFQSRGMSSCSQIAKFLWPGGFETLWNVHARVIISVLSPATQSRSHSRRSAPIPNVSPKWHLPLIPKHPDLRGHGSAFLKNRCGAFHLRNTQWFLQI